MTVLQAARQQSDVFGRAGELFMDAYFSTLVSDLDAASQAEDFRSYLQQLEQAYVRVPPADRELFRRVLRSEGQLRARFWEQMQRVPEQAARAGDYTAHLRARLLLVSVTDRFGSGSLYSEWIDAVAVGLDPAPHFQEIAAISSCDRPQCPLPMSIQAAMVSVAADLGRFWPPDIGRIPELIAALQSGENFQQSCLTGKPFRYCVKMAATAALCVLGPEAKAAVPALCDLLRAQGELLFLVKSALCLIGEGAVSAVQQLLGDPNNAVRLAVLYVLGQMRTTGALALPAMVERLNDEDQLVCCKALSILSDFGPLTRTAVPAVLQLAQDEDYLIRLNARRALQRIDPEAAGKWGG
jgi:hypothetical protein